MLRKIYHYSKSEFLKIKFKHVRFFSGVFIDGNTDFKGKVSVGSKTKIAGSLIKDGTYIGKNCDLTNVKIGKFCSIGSYIRNSSGNHPTNTFVSTHPSFFSLEKQSCYSFVNKQKFIELKKAEENYLVSIGNDVWIGDNVIILDGVKIGDGAIIGANSLVNKDILPFSINVGSPAKVIKFRFNQKQIEWLLKFEWWNKDLSWIMANADSFENIEFFIKNNQIDG